MPSTALLVGAGSVGKRHAAVLAEHRRWLPSVDVPPLAGSEHRILTYDAATDTARWEDRLTIRRGDPIPE